MICLISSQAEACDYVYTDYWFDADAEVISAWGSGGDYWDEGSCYEQAYQAYGYWEHSYYATALIENPTFQRSGEDSDTLEDVPYGGGSVEVLAELSTSGDPGTYTITVELTAYCTEVGAFGTGSLEATQLVCDDDRDRLIQEYQADTPKNSDYSNFVSALTCNSFTSSTSSSSFSFTELRTQGHGTTTHPNWAILSTRLQDGLDALESAVVSVYGTLALDAGGAYRCPSRNRAAGSTSSNPPHCRGWAADIDTETSSYSAQDMWTALRDAAWALSDPGCVEPANYTGTYVYTYIHIDWRDTTCPDGWRP